MYLSKSKYCDAITCFKKIWLEENKSEVKEELSNDSVMDNGTEVGILAKKLLGEHVDIEFNPILSEMVKETKKYLSEENIIITEASFAYDNNFCSVDILRKIGNKFEIYEVKSSTSVKDIYIDDIGYQNYVLSSLGLNVDKCFVVHINSNYVRNGELNIQELFNIVDVTEKAKNKFNEVREVITSLENYMQNKNEPNDDIDIKCNSPYDCPYFKYCTRNLPKNNVFDIRRMNSKMKYQFYHQGIISFEDLLKEDIDWKFRQQIEFELENKIDEFDTASIKKFLDTLSYPLYFLDFETYQESIPMYDGVKPYMQIPFQYSLHYIENEDGPLKHCEFLSEAGIDPRRNLAEALVRDIPMNTCVLAYNMMFEKMVIKNLASLYPDLSEHLMNIHSNMKDLMIPFKDRKYYSKDMKGSYSIKYVLPALFPNDPSLDYHNLDMVHNGSEAMASFANMVNLDESEVLELRKNLLKYCELDTYAMVKIWSKLVEITNNKKHVIK